MKQKLGLVSLTGSMTDMYDFGSGPVPAHKHPNGGGWVADSAHVDDSAYLGPDALVYGDARVYGETLVCGDARMAGRQAS